LKNEEISQAKKAYLQEICGVKFVVLTTQNGKVVAKHSARIKKQLKCVLTEKKVIFAKDLEQIKEAFCLSEVTSLQGEREQKKPAMTFGTALKLSLTNLSSKKFRTLLTALAGSIGILGIALVLGLYSGLNSFIYRQEVALASYPITITRSATEYESMVNTVVSSLDGLDGKYDKDKIYVYKLVQQILKNQTRVNEIDSEFVEALKKVNPELYYDIFMNYGINFNIVKKIPSGTKLFGEVATQSQYYMAINTSSFWTQMPSRELVDEQYELISGEYPRNYNELVLILDGKNQISDINLFFNGLDMQSVSLNYKDSDDVDNLTFDVDNFLNDNNREFRLVPNDSYYVENSSGGFYKNETTKPSMELNLINQEISARVGSGYQLVFFRGDKTTDNTSYTYNNMNGDKLKISGIIKLKDDVSIGVLGTKCIGYLPSLTERVIESAYSSNVVKKILEGYINDYKSKNNGAEPGDWEITSAMRGYGYATIPTSISIYCKGYDAKAGVKNAIAEISKERKAEGKSEIVPSDMMSVVLNVVQQFIDIITCALLCLTAISLVVSALMIGIITYVSVLERTREIGVLRALGARKLDISHIFNTETMVIGFVSGFFGILLTILISLPLSAFIQSMTGIPGLVALPWYFSLALIALSVLLNFVAGLIPAGIAKRKDPVKALRAE
ncbi:MAG: ABC transporter permease, partial [Clostridiales bacterium]|nr:ABC transporter permease [Clostridiales bacterium]